MKTSHVATSNWPDLNGNNPKLTSTLDLVYGVLKDADFVSVAEGLSAKTFLYR